MQHPNIGSWSRRDVIHSLALSAALGLPSFADAASEKAALAKRIPMTGEKLPVVGAGTSFYGNVEYRDVRDMIKRFVELGGSVIDTAAFYGLSEALIGRAVAELGLRKQIFISTKFNAKDLGFGPGEIFGEESFNQSLRSLRTSYVDLLEVHRPVGTDALMPLMQQYKKAGKIRYLGTTTWIKEEHAALIEYMHKYSLDFIQIDYSLGNRAAADDVFPVAVQRKVAVMVNVPLGGVSGTLMNAVKDRELPAWSAEFDAHSWSQFFLKYAISHPAVTCVIPGSTKLTHLEDNQRAGFGRLPDEAMRKRMEEYWDSLPGSV